MKRSEINLTYRQAKACFERAGWALPPNPRWDITDCGLGFDNFVIALINLAEEPEYCEKLIYCVKGKPVPMHCHKQKKEDIICRNGAFEIEMWAGNPDVTPRGTPFQAKINGVDVNYKSGDIVHLKSGERVTIYQTVYHAFWSVTDEIVIGEISTANDDRNDNFFQSPLIGRFPKIEEDEPKQVKLVSDL